MIEKALKGDIKYWAWLGFLGLLILSGAYWYSVQLREGLHITGMSRDVTWGFYIAQFTFLVGVAASGVMVVLPYYLHNYKAFGKLTIMGEFLAVASLIMCILFIFVDMGQPMRVNNVMIYLSPKSPMFWDMVSLSGYLILNILIAFVTLDAEKKGIAPPKWIKPIILISIPWAVSIHTVTAFLYQGLAARPYWMTAILAPRFLATAFSSGPALLILLCFVIRRVTKFDPGREPIQKLAVIVTYAMTVAVFMLLMEVFTAIYSGMPEHMTHFQYLYFGIGEHNNLVPWMWLSTAMAVVSLILLINPATRRNEKTLAIACVAVFISVWIEKGMAMIVAGFVPNPLHHVVEYRPTFPELSISFGIFAIGLLLITVFYKATQSVRDELA